MKYELDDLIDVARVVTNDYPQKWGDCYTVNSTVAYFINEMLGKRIAQIVQVTVNLDRKIYDDEEHSNTDTPHHVILVFSETKDFEVEDNWYDFSNVFTGEREAEILDIEEVLGTLAGREDKELTKLLKDELKKRD